MPRSRLIRRTHTLCILHLSMCTISLQRPVIPDHNPPNPQYHSPSPTTPSVVKPHRLETGDEPPIRRIILRFRRLAVQLWIVHLLHTRRLIPLQTARDGTAHLLPLEPGSVQEAVVLGVGVLAREPQATDVGPEVLMHFEGRAGGPVTVAAERPGGGAPAGIHEGGGLRDVGRAVHVAEDGEDLGLRGGVVLVLGGVGLVGDDCDEEDAGAGEEAGAIEGLEDGIVATFDRVCVEEELGGGVPEYFVCRELEKDFGVRGCSTLMDLLSIGRSKGLTHRKRFDAFLLPSRKLWREFYDIILEDSKTAYQISCGFLRARTLELTKTCILHNLLQCNRPCSESLRQYRCEIFS